MNFYQEMPKVWISQQGLVETFCRWEKVENRSDVQKLADFEDHFDGKAVEVGLLKKNYKCCSIEKSLSQ